ncbi:WD40-repeat-containing domain protein [Xylaria sp. FL1777]|nr:WD40-repeat-containing domain protein [Xylaria sp. FL1777]
MISPSISKIWFSLGKRNSGGSTESSVVTPPEKSQGDPTAAPGDPSGAADETRPRLGGLGNLPINISIGEASTQDHIANDDLAIASVDPNVAASIPTVVTDGAKVGADAESSTVKITIKKTGTEQSYSTISSQHSKSPANPSWIEGTSDLQESTPIQTVNNQQTEPSVVEREKTALLWDTAYDNLKNHHADLISRYELIISTICRGKEKLRVDQTDAVTRRSQMASALKMWLKQVDQKVVGDGEFMNALSGAQSLGGVMGNLVQGLPCTSLGWLATCLGIQATIRHGLAPGTTHSPAIYVASRMQWYLRLPRLIPDNRKTDDNSGMTTEDSSGTVAQHARTFEIAIIDLYTAILLIQILAACSSSEYVSLPPKSKNSENTSFETFHNCPTEQIVVELEQRLHMCLGGIEVEAQLRQLLKFAHLQEDITGSTDELIKKLQVHKPMSRDWSFLKNLSWWEDPGNMDFASTSNCYQVLWVTGDDTSKTIFLHSIVQQLLDPGSLSTLEPRTTVAYLFCDSELKSRPSNSTSIVRSLIWQVLQSQPSLSKHLEHKLSVIERNYFDDSEEFYALSTLLCTLLQDNELNMTYFVLDGLEELCGELSGNTRDPYKDEWGLTDMVRLICASSRLSKRVKWLVSSAKDVRTTAGRQVDNELCHDPKIPPIDDASHDLISNGEHVKKIKEQKTEDAEDQENSTQNVDTNHNAQDSQPIQIHIKVSIGTHNSVRQAVNHYTHFKVRKMASRAKYSENLQSQVKQKLRDCSKGSLLWIDLACDIIESKGVPWNAPHILEDLSSDVTDLYSQMQKELQSLTAQDSEFCQDILSTASIAFRPLSSLELANLVDLPAEVDLEVIIKRMCFAFLEIVDGKDHPKLANYATIYWIRHLSETEVSQASDVIESVNMFLKEHFLQWLEALASQQLLYQAQKYMRVLEATWTKKVTEHDLDYTRENGGINKPGNLAAAALLRKIQGAIWFLDYHHAMPTLEGRSPKHTLIFCPDVDELRDLLPSKTTILGLSIAPVIPSTSRELGIYMYSQVFKGHSGHIKDCAYSPNGRLVASVSTKDESLRLWDSNTGKVQHVLKAPDLRYGMSQVVFSPECLGMLAVTDFSSIQLWHVSTGGPAKTLNPLGVESMKHIVFSSNGEYLIAVTSEIVIRWHLPSFQESVWINLNVKTAADDIIHARFSGDESLLALVTRKNHIEVWDTKEAKVRHRLTNHEDDINDICFSPDSALIASCSNDYTVRVWNTKTGEQMCMLPIKPDFGHSVAFSPDAHRLVCGSGRNVQVWKAIRSTAGVGSYEREHIFKGHDGTVNAVRFSSDGRRILSSSNDKTLRIWRIGRVELNLMAKDDTKLIQMQSTIDSQDTLRTVLNHHSQPISFVTSSPNGKVVASASYEGDILLWDADQGTPLRTLAGGHSRSIRSLAFSQDGKNLVSASSDYAIGIWHVNSGKMVRRLTGHTDWVRDVKISPNGDFVASASDDSTARVWEVADSLKGEAIPEGEENDNMEQTACTTLSEHNDYVYSVAFSPNGQYLASGGDESRILIWDLWALGHKDVDRRVDKQLRQQQQNEKTRNNITKPVWELKKSGTLYDVRGLTFAPPDGETLVSVSTSGIICIWKVATGSHTTEPQQWQFISTINGDKTWPGRAFRFPQFNPKYPDVLLSENGPLLVKISSSWENASTYPRLGTQYGVLRDDQDQIWITKNNKKLLLLPFKYIDDDYIFHVDRNRVVIGCDSGDVLIFGFEDDVSGAECA